MKPSTLTVALTALMALFPLSDVRADPIMLEGLVISAKAEKLVFQDKDNQQHNFTVEPNAKITINGKPGKLEDLQVGLRIRVVTEADGKVLSIATVDDVKRLALPLGKLARGVHR